MKIGILTLHDATNYGAVLQAYGTYRTLTDWGHEVCLIDRRRNPQGYAINYPYSYERPIRMLRRYLCFTGAVMEAIRRWRTYFFQRKWLRFTPYHFHDWKDAPNDLGVDAMVFGSDQIWNKSIQDPMDYMLANQPTMVPSITYAASMGMPTIPAEYKERFRTWIPKFKAVSVRETSLVPVLKELGVEATHVVDPVVLAGASVWRDFVGRVSVRRDKVFVYTLGIEELMSVKVKMSRYAQQQSCSVDIFNGRQLMTTPSLRHPKELLQRIAYWGRLYCDRNVRVCMTAGPMQFLQSLASAETVVTNSYHALVFSVLFGKNVRYVVPKNEGQKAMMVRIYEYAESIVRGPLLQPSLAAALASVASGEKTSVNVDVLESRRQESMRWLRDALDKVLVK